MAKIARDLAEKEIQDWVDFKKMKKSKQVEPLFINSMGILVDGICSGDLVLDPKTYVLTQNLLFPLGENDSIKSIDYSPRVSVGDKLQYEHLTETTNYDRIINSICASTKKPISIIKHMDNEDFDLASSISYFFW